VKVSLAASNVVGYLSMSLAGEQHKLWMAVDVERWYRAVASVRGVVDLISGDRRYASFNARRSCARHSDAAIGVLFDRESSSQRTGCAMTGRAVCGNFGSAGVQRFMVLGAVASSLHTFERIAAAWNIRVLVEGETCATEMNTWNARLIAGLFLPKREPATVLAYRVESKRSGAEDIWDGPQVWMSDEEGEFSRTNRLQKELIEQEFDRLRLSPVEAGTGEGVVFNVREVGLFAGATTQEACGSPHHAPSDQALQ